jgi:hypothetical protein
MPPLLMMDHSPRLQSLHIDFDQARRAARRYASCVADFAYDACETQDLRNADTNALFEKPESSMD